MRNVCTVLLVFAVLLGCVSSVHGVCSPRSILIPPANLSGYLSCKNGETPSNVSVTWFKVDGVTCDPDNYDFSMIGSDRFMVEFWIDNSIAHDLQLCLSAKCGSQTVSAGFSPDGTTPGDCNESVFFPQYAYAIIVDVVFPLPPTPTPTPTNTPTSIYTSTPTPTGTVPATNTPGPNEYILDLCSGLNMASMIVTKDVIPNAKTLLESFCEGKADAVWKYNCETQSFESFTKLDSGDGWATSDAMPVYVNIAGAEDCDWRITGQVPDTVTVDMCVGQNMVPLPVFNTTIVLASQLLEDIDNCTAIWGFNREGDCPAPYGFKAFFDISPAIENFFIHNGYSYWANVSSATTWTISKP